MCCSFWLSRSSCRWGGLVELLSRYRTHDGRREETKGQRRVLYSRFSCVDMKYKCYFI